MAQHDYVIANGTGAAVRSDINNGLSAIVTQNSGATEPTTTYAYMRWADTTAGVMKMRNGANSAWITLYQLDGEWSTIAFENGTAAAPSIYFKDSGTDTGFYSPGANQVGISTGGTAALVIDSSQRVGLGTSSAQQKLHVSSADSSATYLRIDNTSGQAMFGVDSSGNTYAGAETNDAFGLVTNGTYRMYITAGGSVGIGTTAPGYTLDVSGQANIKPAAGYNALFQQNSTSLRINYLNDAASANVSAAYRATDFSWQKGDGSEIGRFDSSGRLLIGTSSTIHNGDAIQIVADNTNCLGLFSGRNDIYGPRIDFVKARGTTASPSTVSNGDQLGNILFYGYSGGYVTGASIEAYVDAAVSGTEMPSRLVFSTTADGASSPTERMRICNNGTFRFTTSGNYTSTTSNYNEIYQTNTAVALYARNTSGTPYGYQIYHDTAANNTGSEFFYASDVNAQRCAIRSNGGIANYQANNVNLCDEREKKNIVNLDSTWDCLKHWELKKFHYNEDADTDDLRYGVIAQQVADYCPEVISEWVKQKAEPAKLDEEGNEIEPAKEEILRMAVKEQQMMWMAIKALQEAQLRIEALEAEVAALKGA